MTRDELIEALERAMRQFVEAPDQQAWERVERCMEAYRLNCIAAYEDAPQCEGATVTMQETVARIIDPDLWAENDYPPTSLKGLHYQAMRRRSLEKADAVLEALAALGKAE